jgi:uncharacterized lipoprotein YmbA
MPSSSESEIAMQDSTEASNGARMTHRHARLGVPRIMGLALMLSVAGCGSKPPTHWLALPLPRDVAPAASADSVAAQAPADSLESRRVLVVRRVNVPEYLQTNSVRFRQSDSLLAEWPDVLWADRLEVGLTEHLVMRLRKQLPQWTVCERQCPPLASGITLHLEFAPFDYVRPARELRAEARWQLSQRDKGAGQSDKAAPASMQTHRISEGMKGFALRVDSDSAAGQVAAMGALLDELATDLAKAAQGWQGP